MSKEFIFSVDPGKGFTKYAKVNENGDFVHDLFETKYTKVQELNVRPPGKDSFDVTYNNENYVLGVQGELDLREDRSKKNEIHRIATLVAITRLLKNVTEGGKVKLAVSMPAGSFTNKKENQEFKEFYKGEGDIEITVNGIDYKFTIEDVIALPEGAGFSFKHANLCRGNLAIVDIGHLNINLLTMKDNNILQMASLDKGGKELEAITTNRLEALLDCEVNSSIIVETLINGHYTQFGNSVKGSEDIIKSVKEEYVDSLVKKADERGIDLSIMNKIYFIGGTSELLESTIKEHKQLHKISEVREDSRWVTVEGNLIFALATFGQLGECSDN